MDNIDAISFLDERIQSFRGKSVAYDEFSNLLFDIDNLISPTPTGRIYMKYELLIAALRYEEDVEKASAKLKERLRRIRSDIPNLNIGSPLSTIGNEDFFDRTLTERDVRDPFIVHDDDDDYEDLDRTLTESNRGGSEPDYSSFEISETDDDSSDGSGLSSVRSSDLAYSPSGSYDTVHLEETAYMDPAESSGKQAIHTFILRLNSFSFIV